MTLCRGAVEGPLQTSFLIAPLYLQSVSGHPEDDSRYGARGAHDHERHGGGFSEYRHESEPFEGRGKKDATPEDKPHPAVQPGNTQAVTANATDVRVSFHGISPSLLKGE